MSDEKDYSFCVLPGNKTRHIAGPFDRKDRTPHYEIEIDVPEHVRSQVEVKQFVVGTSENCEWAWDIRNNSTYPVFVTIKKDGEKI